MPRLRPKQEAFARAFVEGATKAAAARHAGYSAHSASHIGCTLLRRADVQVRIQELVAERENETRLQRHLVLRELEFLAFSSMDDYEWSADGRLVTKPGVDPHAITAVRSWHCVRYPDGRMSASITMRDKVSMLTLCMKYLGLLKERIEVRGDDVSFAALLARARERVAGSRTTAQEHTP